MACDMYRCRTVFAQEQCRQSDDKFGETDHREALADDAASSQSGWVRNCKNPWREIRDALRGSHTHRAMLCHQPLFEFATRGTRREVT